MIQHMLDTDICIYIIRRKPADVIKRLVKSRISEIGISSITLSELEYGVEKSSKQEQNNEKEFGRVPNLKIDNWAK
jgi:tRNA(fMet)-specific endonuclease VapC